MTVAVVESTSIEEIRRAMGPRESPRLDTGPHGTIVTSDDGDLGTASWDISVALPGVTVFHLQHDRGPERFSVLVMKAGEIVDELRRPVLDEDTELAEVKGARTPRDILAAFGVRPDLLGY